MKVSELLDYLKGKNPDHVVMVTTWRDVTRGDSDVYRQEFSGVDPEHEQRTEASINEGGDN